MADLQNREAPRFSIRGIYNSLTSESKAPPPPPPPPPPKQAASEPAAISSYAGMTALQRREKEAGMKDGGQMKDGASGTVPGKGKGDKIKAKYEPGEFVVSNAMLSANPGLEQYLHQLRTQALAAQGKTAEDTAAGGFKGGFIHALNGLDPNERQTAMYVAGAQAAAQARQLAAPNAAAGPDNTLGNFTPPPGQRYVAPSAPAPAAAPVAREVSPFSIRGLYRSVDPARGVVPGSADGGPMPGTTAVMRGFGQDASENINNGQYGALVGNTARATAAMVPAVLSDVASPVLSGLAPVGQGIANAVKTFATGDSTPVAASNPAKPAATAIPGGAPGAQTDVQRGGAATPANVAPSAPAQPAIAAEPAQGAIRRIDTPGQSPMFTNMPNDGALMARGPVSAMNEQAAQNLSQRYSSGPDGSPLVNEQPQGFQPATIRHSGNDWSARNDLRNLQVSASSITAGPGSSADTAYQKALSADLALKGGNDPYTVALNRDGAATERANTLERGALTRTAMQEAGTNMRAGMIQRLAQQKDAREEAKFGMDKASAERIQSAQIALVNAKTPEEASKARQLLNTLMGRESKALGWKGIALQGGTDAMGNKTDSVLAVVNEGTGEMRRMDGGAKPAQQYDTKTIYKDANGNTARWDGEKFVPVK